MNPGIAQIVAAQFFLSTTYQVTETSCLLVLTLIASHTHTQTHTHTLWKDLENDYNSSLSLKVSSKLELLVNQFNNTTLKNGNDPEKIASSKYYDIDEIHNIEIPHTK